jgi:hypothetical protein
MGGKRYTHCELGLCNVDNKSIFPSTLIINQAQNREPTRPRLLTQTAHFKQSMHILFVVFVPEIEFALKLATSQTTSNTFRHLQISKLTTCSIPLDLQKRTR